MMTMRNRGKRANSAPGQKNMTASGEPDSPALTPLDGKTWLRYSISVWNDIAKTASERPLQHPASFPESLIRRLLGIFYRMGRGVVLDPFMGSGSTVYVAASLGFPAVGIELSPDYLKLAAGRLANLELSPACRPRLYQGDSRKLCRWLEPESAGICITSPPYWNVLHRRRSADHREPRNYGENRLDLGNISDYDDYLAALGQVFGQVRVCLLPGAYCLVVVMDLRKGPCFYPLHMDLTAVMLQAGFILDDLIIWDRRSEYNRLRPLGYPHVFRVNKVHEYIMIFQKPAPVREKKGTAPTTL